MIVKFIIENTRYEHEIMFGKVFEGNSTNKIDLDGKKSQDRVSKFQQN